MVPQSLQEASPCRHFDFRTTDLQKCKIVNMCSFKLLS